MNSITTGKYSRFIKNIYDLSDYISVEEFVNYPHGIEIDRDSMTDLQIKKLLNYAGLLIQEYIDKPFLHQQITETRWGSGSQRLLLANADANTKLISCIEKDMVDAKRDLTSYVSYSPNLEMISIKNYHSPRFCADCEYEITYTAGDIEIADHIKTATILTAANILRTQEIATMASVQIDIIKIQFQKMIEIIPEEAKQLLGYWISSKQVI